MDLPEHPDLTYLDRYCYLRSLHTYTRSWYNDLGRSAACRGLVWNLGTFRTIRTLGTLSLPEIDYQKMEKMSRCSVLLRPNQDRTTGPDRAPKNLSHVVTLGNIFPLRAHPGAAQLWRKVPRALTTEKPPEVPSFSARARLPGQW